MTEPRSTTPQRGAFAELLNPDSPPAQLSSLQNIFLQSAAKQITLPEKISNTKRTDPFLIDQLNCGQSQAETVPMLSNIDNVQISHLR